MQENKDGRYDSTQEAEQQSRALLDLTITERTQFELVISDLTAEILMAPSEK